MEYSCCHCHSPFIKSDSFCLFSSFLFSPQDCSIKLSVAGFEPGSSDIASDPTLTSMPPLLSFLPLAMKVYDVGPPMNIE